MFCSFYGFRFLRLFALLLGILSSGKLAAAQIGFERAPTPIADPADTRFKTVHEDLTTPSLSTSSLLPVGTKRAYLDERQGYTVELLQVQWRWGDPIDLYVLKPTGVKKPQVILYLYGFPTDTDKFKDEAWQRTVTQDGFAAVGFVSALTGHRYHDRPMKEWFISELQECLAVSAHDVQMVLNYLETRGDLDVQHVGMFAEGSGASIGILASAVDPRIAVLDATSPWGDWPVWMAKSPFPPENERANYVKPEYLSKVAGLDPVQWLPKIQARHFRLQDAPFESDTPAEAKSQLKAAVPPGATVLWYKTQEEYSALMQNNKVLDWMHAQLRGFADTPSASLNAQKK
jgi:hypothetical protein